MNPRSVDITYADTKDLQATVKDLQQEIVRRKVAQVRDKFYPEASLFQLDLDVEDKVFWLNIEPLNGPEPEEITEPDQKSDIFEFMDEIGLPDAAGLAYFEILSENEWAVKVEVDVAKPTTIVNL